MARTLTLLADGHHSRLVHKYGGDSLLQRWEFLEDDKSNQRKSMSQKHLGTVVH
jgi:hypothetical protein